MAGLFSPQINPIGTPPGVQDDGGSTIAAVGNVLGSALQAFGRSDPGTLSARQPTKEEISDAALKPFYARALESQQLLESGDISALQHKTNLSVLSREVATMAPSMIDDFQGDMESILGINIKEENARIARLRDASDTANVGTNLAINYLEGGNENQKALMAAGSVAAASAGLDAEQTQAYLGGIALDIARREGEIAKVHAINDPVAKKRAIQELGRHLTPSLMGVVIPAAIEDPEQLAAISGSGQGFSLYQNIEAGVNAIEQYWRNELTDAGLVYEEEDIKEIMAPFRQKLDIFGRAVGRTLEESKGIRTQIGQAAITTLLAEEGIIGKAAERAYDEYMGWLVSNDPAAMANVTETLSKFIQEGKLPALLPVFQWTSEMIDTGQGSNLDQVLFGLFDNVEIRDGYRVALNTAYYYKEALHEADQFRKRRSQTAGTVLAAETFNKALGDDQLTASSLEIVGDEVNDLMTTETKNLPVAQQAAKDKVVTKINAAREVELTRVNDMLADANIAKGEIRGVEVGASGLYTVAVDPNGELGKFMRHYGLEPTLNNVGRAVAMNQMAIKRGRQRGDLKPGELPYNISPPRMNELTRTINALEAVKPHLDKLNVIENKAQQWVDANPGLSTANILSGNPARTAREQQIIGQAGNAEALSPFESLDPASAPPADQIGNVRAPVNDPASVPPADQRSNAVDVEAALQQPTGGIVNSNSENPAIVETAPDVEATTPLGVTVETNLASAESDVVDVAPILNSLAFFEGTPRSPGGRGDYSVVYGRGISGSDLYEVTGTSKPVTEMTLDELDKFQADAQDKGSKSSAVGRYQIIRKTLKQLRKEMKLPGDAVFTPELQDKMAFHLLTSKRGYDKFIEGEMSVEDFALELAKEWASFPVLKDTTRNGKTIKRGQSYYSGVAGNASKFTEEQLALWENYLSDLQSVKIAEAAASEKETT